MNDGLINRTTPLWKGLTPLLLLFGLVITPEVKAQDYRAKLTVTGEDSPEPAASPLLMLDDTGGSTTHGTQLQTWTDNGQATQHWILQP